MAEPSPADIIERWTRASGLGAPIGLTSAGIRQIDLREDGPHALLGGTTGAGKSELLQALVVSLATHHPPERLTFLLVDYKGGAAFKDCLDLPHTVGSVTDLDGHLVHRVLVSLHAELSHRERLLAAAGAKDLIEMERIDPLGAPPSLVLVVDEFAALATELPEFVDGVVNLAQRGRSLGMHLVLATQRPAGAINDNIRANTNLRISLRMNDAADSEDVIGSALAAALPRSLPGRAYLRTGADELDEVQVAYGGGRSFGTDRAGAMVTIRSGGRVGHSTRRLPGQLPPDGATDLQQLVSVIAEAHRTVSGSPPRRPWLPPLPVVLTTGELPPRTGAQAPIGLRDEPGSQLQAPEVVDLPGDGGMLVVGASGSGKTTLLRTLACALATQTGPDELHLYAMDFASRGLGPLTALPHCGAVIVGEEIDRCTRLLGQVDRWLKERRDVLGRVGATSLEELHAVEDREGRARTPRIVVLLDGYGAFSQAFEKVEYGRWLERLPLMVAEGRSVGIHWVVTADRRLTLSGAMVAGFDARLVLRLADIDEYDAFGLDRKTVAGAVLPPGRGFTDEAHEVQVAVVGGAAGEAQLQAVGELGEHLRSLHGGAAVAPPIRLLPTEVSAADLPAHLGPLHPVLGLDDADLAPIGPDLTMGDLLVAGPPRSGKSTALATLATSLRAAHPEARMILIAPRSTPLRDLGVWDEQLSGDHHAEERLEQLLDIVRDGDEQLPQTLLVVDDAHELIDSTIDEHLDALARFGRDHPISVLLAADRSGAHRAYGGIVQRVRGDRHGLLLQPDVDTDGDLLGTALDRRHGGGPPGRGILVTPVGATRIQCAAPVVAR